MWVAERMLLFLFFLPKTKCRLFEMRGREDFLLLIYKPNRTALLSNTEENVKNFSGKQIIQHHAVDHISAFNTLH